MQDTCFQDRKIFLWCDSESISTPGKLKDMSVHGGNQIYIRPLDYHPNAVSKYYSILYTVRSVPGCDIAELSQLLKMLD